MDGYQVRAQTRQERLTGKPGDIEAIFAPWNRAKAFRFAFLYSEQLTDIYFSVIDPDGAEQAAYLAVRRIEPIRFAMIPWDLPMFCWTQFTSVERQWFGTDATVTEEGADGVDMWGLRPFSRADLYVGGKFITRVYP